MISVRLQALYAIYDNCITLPAYDEAITTPTESVRAMAIQLIINKEVLPK
jgi:methylmalonyl-CoA mutase N-terminal domain/subunit